VYINYYGAHYSLNYLRWPHNIQAVLDMDEDTACRINTSL